MPQIWRERFAPWRNTGYNTVENKVVASLIMKLKAWYIYKLKHVIELTFSKSWLTHRYDF